MIHDDLRRATVALADCSRSVWEWAPGILHLKLARTYSLFGTAAAQPTELDHFGIKCWVVWTLRPQMFLPGLVIKLGARDRASTRMVRPKLALRY